MCTKKLCINFLHNNKLIILPYFVPSYTISPHGMLFDLEKIIAISPKQESITNKKEEGYLSVGIGFISFTTFK